MKEMKDSTYNEQMLCWLDKLKSYADGTTKWSTGGVWVCKSHPCTPFEMGYPFDCKCGGPGMPPSTPDT